MPKTWELLSLNEVGHYEDRASTREEYSLKISDYKKTKAKILTAITADDGSALKSLCTDVYTPVLRAVPPRILKDFGYVSTAPIFFMYTALNNITI